MHLLIKVKIKMAARGYKMARLNRGQDLSKYTVPTSFIVPTKVVGMLVALALPTKVVGMNYVKVSTHYKNIRVWHSIC